MTTSATACRRYDVHPPHGECTGLTELQPHAFEGRANFEGDYIRCCNRSTSDGIHTVAQP